MPIEVKGIEELAKRLRVATEAAEAAAKSAVYGQAVALAELANRKGMVPVQSGRLRASLYITAPQRVGNGVVVEMGYGASYAPVVHERSARPGMGSPRWLEKAANIHARALQVRLRESIMAALRSGVAVAPSVTGIPTRPPPEAPVGAYQRKRGFTRDQARAISRLRRSGAIRLVRRWKKRRRK